MDFRGSYVDVQANDVTFRDCLFDAASGFFTLRQFDGYAGLSVRFCTFDDAEAGHGAGTAVLTGTGRAVVNDNVFVGLPGDAINVSSGEAVGNLIASLGWDPQAHADGIVVAKSTGPIRIANNIIDGSERTPAGLNWPIQVNPTAGDITYGVEILTNILIGGTYALAIGRGNGTKHIRGVVVRGNVIGDAKFGVLYPTNRPADLVFENNVAFGTGRPLKP